MMMMMPTSSTANASSSPLSLSKTTATITTCSSLLHELQEIWDEIGENDSERDKMLLQLEQECLDIYRRNVEKTRKHKADLHQSLAEMEAEIARLASALGERASIPQYEKMKGTLKQQISLISPVLEELRSRKHEKVKEFLETELQIVAICAEIDGSHQSVIPAGIHIDESDLTIKRLGELKSQLQELQSEKSLRLQKVSGYVRAIRELSIIMSLDFRKILAEIHPSLVDLPNGQSKSISNGTLARLTSEVNSLREEKQQRLQKLQNLASTLTELWNLMETPVEEQRRFDHVTCFISSSIDGAFSQGCLANNVISETVAEVERLNILKASKMKELILKRQCELEEIYRGVHMDVDSETARQILVSLIESGNVNLSDLLSNMDDQIAKAKEQALSRKDVLDKVEKWKHAAEEESWLDEYERDENRYSAGRGAHKNLKRAEKARILVNKIPSLVENLITKIKAWEMEKGMPFLYDKALLLRTLEEYTTLRREKEEEKRRSREQKRLQEQFAAEQEAIYGSKPTVKKPLGQSTSGNTILGTPSHRAGTPARHAISGGKERRDSGKVGNVIPVNYVALPKDDQTPRRG